MPETSGFLLLNKPAGPTSHDMIDKLRKITGIKKIGHAGTLDPFAPGLLIVAIGRPATRQLDNFVKLDKEYRAILRLGARTDTYDRTGKIFDPQADFIKPGLPKIKKAVQKFIGEQKQTPPMYSAKKIKGKKLYEMARAGIEVECEPSVIKIYDIQIIKYQWPNLEIKVKCSSGTYIRALADDVGQALGCGAYLNELERIAIGKYKLNEAVFAKDIGVKNWFEYFL